MMYFYIMLSFEWHPEKAYNNVQKHGVTSDEACTVFSDTFSLTIHDPLHSTEEDRFIIIGLSCSNRILTIVHTDRKSNIRIISARKAIKKERLYYENYAE